MMDTLEYGVKDIVKDIFDSHAHYDDPAFESDREEAIQMIHENGVCGVIDIGCNLDSSRLAIGLSEQYDWFRAAVGFHPGNALSVTDRDLAELRKLAAHEKVVAIGEIGLDYHYDKEHKDLQKSLFSKQVEIALELNLPVIIHSRDASADTLSILKGYPDGGVVHCFTGSPQTATQLLSIGYYIGFTGAVTFNNAVKVKQSAAIVPLDRLLLETDAPYMTPVPFRGKRCTSDLIRHTAKAIADIKGIPVQDVVDAARENTKRLFRIP